MFNPIETVQKIKSRLGKPVRPVIELQKNASILNIITNSIQDGNVLRDTYHDETWAIDPESRSVAVYIDGVFKGIGHWACELGVTTNLTMDIKPQKEIEITKDGETTTTKVPAFVMVFKGIFSKLIDGAIIEKGSALKPSMMQTIIYCIVALAFGFMAGMSY